MYKDHKFDYFEMSIDKVSRGEITMNQSTSKCIFLSDEAIVHFKLDE